MHYVEHYWIIRDEDNNETLIMCGNDLSGRKYVAVHQSASVEFTRTDELSEMSRVFGVAADWIENGQPQNVGDNETTDYIPF